MRTLARPLAASAAIALFVTACGGEEGNAGSAQDTTTEDRAATQDGDAAEDTSQDTADEADDASEADTADETDEAGDAGDTEDDAAGSEDGTRVAVASSELGEILVDGEGRTLYLFDPDEQGPSQCYDDCADNWPPLTTDGEPTAEQGAEPDRLGTVERDDGSVQVTYDDWPLYHFAADQEPGDVAGQGVQDVWWVLSPDGAPQRDGQGTDDEEDADEADVSY